MRPVHEHFVVLKRKVQCSHGRDSERSLHGAMTGNYDAALIDFELPDAGHVSARLGADCKI